MAKPTPTATVQAMGPTHVLPEMDLVLPHGTPVPVPSDLVERLLTYEGVVQIEAAPATVPEAPSLTITPAAKPAQPSKE